jgi:hypothetical protein
MAARRKLGRRLSRVLRIMHLWTKIGVVPRLLLLYMFACLTFVSVTNQAHADAWDEPYTISKAEWLVVRVVGMSRPAWACVPTDTRCVWLERYPRGGMIRSHGIELTLSGRNAATLDDFKSVARHALEDVLHIAKEDVMLPMPRVRFVFMMRTHVRFFDCKADSTEGVLQFDRTCTEAEK